MDLCVTRRLRRGVKGRVQGTMMTNREVPFALPIIPMHILIIRKKHYLKFINGKKNANRSLCRGVCVLKFIILSVVRLDGAYEFDEFKFFNPNKYSL